MSKRLLGQLLATLVVAGACIRGSAPAQNQAPAGYHLGAAVATPDSVHEVSADGRFEAAIHRVARTAKDRELIALAERLYPDSATLLAAARDSTHRSKLNALSAGVIDRPYRNTPRVAGRPSDRWWLDGVAHVVELRISWEYSCGPLCALSFTHTRMVWFNARGEVVRITGDRPPVVIVS